MYVMYRCAARSIVCTFVASVVFEGSNDRPVAPIIDVTAAAPMPTIFAVAFRDFPSWKETTALTRVLGRLVDRVPF